jgi:hypothetical protein
MISFTNITGLAGCALAIAAACVRVPGISYLSRNRRTWLLAVVFVAALVPFHGLPLAAYVRGATGDLSVPTLLLLAAAILRFLSGGHANKESIEPRFCRGKGRRALLLLIVLAAVALYPMALGWGGFDPYRSGYGSPWLLALLLAAAMAAIFLGLPEIAYAVTLAVLAWGAGWYESGNLWDYLLDPLVAVYAAGSLALYSVSGLSGRRANKTV